MARATSSLPVPVSPVISTVALVGRDLADHAKQRLHHAAAADDPTVIGHHLDLRLLLELQLEQARQARHVHRFALSMRGERELEPTAVAQLNARTLGFLARSVIPAYGHPSISASCASSLMAVRVSPGISWTMAKRWFTTASN